MNELRIGTTDYERLRAHLLQPDRDEHGAILLAGQHQRADGGVTLTVREVHPLGAADFPPGEHGYRQLSAQALARLGNRAADEGLALVSAHSHPISTDRTGLSRDDLNAHERIFSHLLDITDADAVCGIAFGQAAAAGEVWRRSGAREPLDQVRVVGPNVTLVHDAPRNPARPADARYDRQVRMFGEAGQARLRGLHVAVIGAGGGGSILIEQLAHLGVGHITAVDYDVVKTHNLSRIMGATDADARDQTKKVTVAARHVAAIDPTIAFDAIDGDIADRPVAERLLACDYLFLATDTATARLVANAIAQSFLIPLVQVGAKVETREDGAIEQIYTAVRPVLPRRGCLHCAGLIDPMQLQHEAATPEERDNQNYLGTEEVIDPSVTTLNAAAAAGALNVFLMGITGLAYDELADHRVTLTREGTSIVTGVVNQETCRWCGAGDRSRYARADLDQLPCRPAPPLGSDRPRQRPRWLRYLLARLRGRSPSA
jgi:molybdopterin/thiamine biosynthesis adenylyltransferase